MSFRELRNFTEMMRALGYPRLISVDNFRTPNFELVADILYWMVKRYDPDIPISDNIESEADRVEFLLGVSQALATKAHIRMNAKRLYSADGRAVQELLKLATLLYKASRAEEDAAADGADEGADPAPLASQLGSVKEARALAAEITERGARLHDLLGQEPIAARARLRAAAFLEAATAAGGGGGGAAAEMQHVEASLREIVARARENLSALQRQTVDLESDERGLDGRIKKAQADLERNEKRLRSLQTHRPAFADELEKLQGELQRYYEVYMVRFRNLDYLEQEVERYAQAERAEMEEHNRRRNRNAEKVRKEQLKQFINRDGMSEAAIEEELQRNKYAPAAGAPEEGPARVPSGNAAGGTGGAAGAAGAAAAAGAAGGRAVRRHANGSASSGSDINSSGTGTEDEISLNDSSEGSGSLINDDDESSEGEHTGSASGSDDEF